MTDPMRQSGFFPPMVTQMVSVGESTGEIDSMLVKVADFYEEEVDNLIDNLSSLMEPFILVILGILVGEPPFTGMDWYAGYGARHASDGREGRLVPSPNSG